MSHTYDGFSAHSHSNDFNAEEHGHSHEILDGPGSYTDREMPIIEGRDWTERAFTVGIGGYAPLMLLLRKQAKGSWRPQSMRRES